MMGYAYFVEEVLRKNLHDPVLSSLHYGLYVQFSDTKNFQKSVSTGLGQYGSAIV